MSNSIEAIKKQIELLQLEQENDREQHKEKIAKSSIQERKQLGITWYPIIIKDSYYGYGDRLIIEIERPTDNYQPNLFQVGCTVSLFSNHPNYNQSENTLNGIVNLVRLNQLRITLSVDELPEWIDSGKIGVNLLFDETSYKEMNSALQTVLKAEKNKISLLREIILGETIPQFHEFDIPSNPRLNESQNNAMKMAINAQDIAIIHGPPGTGKTTTLVETIKVILNQEKQILVCAASNTAVDLLTEKLADRGLNVLRIGNPAKMSENILKHTVDFKSSNHADYKRIKEFKKRASEFKNFASKYKRNFGREERQQRKLILDEAKKLHLEAENIEKYILDDLLSKAQIVTCTLVGSAHYTIKEIKFTTVVIDEAGQALEAACWIPITKAQKVIMAGDHLQLPPTIKSDAASTMGLKVTLLEKMMQKNIGSTLLDTQYRMNEKIMQFSNEQFYQNKLIAHTSVKNICLEFQDASIDDLPIEFIDTAGCSFEEKPGKDHLSLCNEEEANLIFNHLRGLNSTLQHPASIGIISPYKAQVTLIQDKITKESNTINWQKISINTIDGFQGQEKDIIYISLVRSNGNNEIGFLSDTRRMNVAMTRAKKKLVIIGDSATLSSHSFYNQFLEYISKINAHKTAWEYTY